MNLKPKHLFLAIVTTALISCIITASVLSSTTTSTFYISGGVYPGAPSFTIWTESGSIFSKDKNGLIVFSSTNASYVIQSSIDELPSNEHGYLAGIVHINAGQYLIDTTLTIQNPNIILEGEGRATEFKLDSTSLDYMIKIVSNRLPPEYTYTHGVQIKNILFWYDTSISTYTIYFHNNINLIWFPIVENIWTINLNGILTDSDAYGEFEAVLYPIFTGIYMIDPPNCGFNLTNVVDLRLEKTLIYSAAQKNGTLGIYLNSTITSGAIISQAEIIRQGKSLYLSCSADAKITNSYFDLNNDTYAILLENSDRVELTDVYIHAPYGAGLLLTGSTERTHGYAISARACLYGIVDNATSGGHANEFYSTDMTGTSNWWTLSSTDRVFGAGYQNSGVAAMSGSTVVVTHYLYSTPTSVGVTCAIDNTIHFSVTTVGATTFTITASSSFTGNIYWSGEYKP